MVSESLLEYLPEHLVLKILEFFQTKKTVDTSELSEHELSEHELSQLIARRRKLIDIKTDLPSILNLSMTNRYFNELVKKSNIGKLILTIHYNSDIIDFLPKLQHISYCDKIDCKNICHYVNKDIKHSNLIKTIAIARFNKLKNDKDFKEDIIPQFSVFLTSKQIESYYKIKKMNKELKDYHGKAESRKSWSVDPISLDSDYH